jgi:predicted secreted hydrolase
MSRLIVVIYLSLSQLVPIATSQAEPFEVAVPGYHYSFPKDHGSHDAYRTEWWYYTGHLQTTDGRAFGYQLTFFRSAMEHPTLAINPSRWAIHHIYLAHFAVTDEDKKSFFYTEKVNRAGVGNAGAKTGFLEVWNDHWKAISVPSRLNPEIMTHHLTASEGEWAIDLILSPVKPPVIHGEKGISKKGEALSQASHYYSLTQMETRGTLKTKGLTLEVKGTSWMDHEFGSNQLSENQVGWDWFGIQLNNGIELMLYQVRQKAGIIDPVSSGTLIWPDGTSKYFPLKDFQVVSEGFWQSPKSGGKYPRTWQISIPSEGISLNLMPTVTDQELITTKSTGVTYWEGSVKIQGTHKGHSIAGMGYVELTGYAGSMRKKL